MNTRQYSQFVSGSPVLELLEDRILLSADPLGLAVGAVLDSGDWSIADPLQLPELSQDVVVAKEVVIVDTGVRGVDQLLDTLLATRRDSEVAVHRIDSSSNAIEQVAGILASYQSLDAIHVLGHASDNSLLLGDSVVNTGNVHDYNDLWAAWGTALANEGDLLFYGCNLAASDDGQQLLTVIAASSGADVAASSNDTGATSLGGDWVLEYTHGSIESRSLSPASGGDSWVGLLASITVDTELDVNDAPDLSSVLALLANPGADGFVSLREAVTATNADPGQDTLLLQTAIYRLSDTTGPAAGSLVVTDGLNIVGKGQTNTVIRADGSERPFRVDGGNLSIYNLALENNSSTSLLNGNAIDVQSGEAYIQDVVIDTAGLALYGGAVNVEAGAKFSAEDSEINNNRGVIGGGIYNAGITNLLRVSLTGNAAFVDPGLAATLGGGTGGAIHNIGTLTLEDVELVSNLAQNTLAAVGGTGAALMNHGASSMDRVLFEANLSARNGGAIYQDTGQLDVNNSLFIDNNSGSDGGAIHIATGTAKVASTSFMRNTAGGSGAAIDQFAGSVEVISSLFSLNSAAAATDADFSGAVTSLGYNLYSAAGGLTTAISDQVAVNAGVDVGAFGQNGGFIRSVPLSSGSGAINAGANLPGSLSDSTYTTRDEFPDIGAFEYRGNDAGSKLYWTDLAAKSIFRANIDGSAVQRIYQSAAETPFDIEVATENGFLYWVEANATEYTDGGTGKLKRAAFDGRDPAELATNLAFPKGLAVDVAGDRIFVTQDSAPSNTAAENSIVQYHLDGTPYTTFVILSSTPTNPSSFYVTYAPNDVEYDAVSDALYVTDQGNGVVGTSHIKYLQTDGTVLFRVNATALIPTRGIAISDTGTTGFAAAGDLIARLDGLGTLVPPPTASTTTIDGVSPSQLVGVAQDSETGRVYYSYGNGGAGVIASRAASLLPGTLVNFVSGQDYPTAIAIAGVSSVLAAPQYLGPATVLLYEGERLPLKAHWQASATGFPANLLYSIVTSPAYGQLVDDVGAPLTVINQQLVNDGKVFYQHDGGESVLDEVFFTLTEGLSSTPEIRFTLQIDPLNDAPSLLDVQLPDVNEDSTSHNGDTVADLYAAAFADTDPQSSQTGIAVEVNDATVAEGLWQYFAPGGSWQDMPVVNQGSALVLGMTTRLRFLPAAEYSGTPPPLQVRGVDNSYPASIVTTPGNPITINTSSASLSSSYSNALTDIAVRVNPVSDSPTAAGVALPAIAEDDITSSGATIAGLLGGVFVDTDSGSSLSGIGVVGNSTSIADGRWEYSVDGASWREIDNFRFDVNALALDTSARLRFQPSANFNGSPTDLEFRVLDNTFTGVFSNIFFTSYVNLANNGGSTPASGVSYGLSSSVSAVNDAPTAANAVLSAVAEDTINSTGSTVTALLGASFSDVDNSAPLFGAALVGDSTTAAQGQWQYTVNGTDWLAVTVLSETNALLLDADSRLRFIPAADYNGLPGLLIARVMDNSYAGLFSTAMLETRDDVSVNGGATPYSAATYSVATAVTARNDAPSANAVSLPAVAEDATSPAGALISSLYATEFTDIDAGSSMPGLGIVADLSTTAQGTWQYSVDTVDWVPVGAVNETSALMLSSTTTLRFLPQVDAEGAVGELQVRVIDNSSASTFSAGSAQYTDLSLNGEETAIAASTSSISVTIDAANDAPTASDAFLPTVPEDTLSAAGSTVSTLFGGSFVDIDASASLAGLVVVGNDSVADQGRWQYAPANGSWVAISGVSNTSALLIDAGTRLRFLPAADFNGAIGSLTARVVDNSFSGGFSTVGGEIRTSVLTAGGATPFSAAVVTLGSSVAPVNDVPSAVVLDNTLINENIFGAPIGNVTVTDADSGDVHSVVVDDSRFEVVGGVLQLRAGTVLDFEVEAEIPLRLTAIDSAGAGLETSLTLQVQNVNEVPSLVTAPRPQNGQAPFSFSVPGATFTDADGDTLAYQATRTDGGALPDWLVFDNVTLSFRVDSSDSAPSDITVLLVASDGNGGSASTPLRISLQQSTVLEPEPVTEPATAPAEPEQPVVQQESEIVEVPTAVEPVSLVVAPAETIDVAGESKTDALQSIDVVNAAPILENLQVLAGLNPEILAPEILLFETSQQVTIDKAGQIDTDGTPEVENALPGPAIDSLLQQNTVPLSRLFELSDDDLLSSFATLADLVDEQWSQTEDDLAFSQRIVGTSVTLSTGLSVGYVLWLVRGGTLLGSVLSTLPAWRFIDPLPVLDTLVQSEDDEGDESLESMVSDKSADTSHREGGNAGQDPTTRGED